MLLELYVPIVAGIAGYHVALFIGMFDRPMRAAECECCRLGCSEPQLYWLICALIQIRCYCLLQACHSCSNVIINVRLLPNATVGCFAERAFQA
jgi:hypothetical protein